MPELPEVETVVTGLKPRIEGKTIVDIHIYLPKTVWLGDMRATGQTDVDQFISVLVGKKITAISRRGKMIIIELSEDLILLVHLKMTGQLIYIGSDEHRVVGGHPSADLAKQLPVKSTRAVINFSDNGKLFFNDQRQFGYLKLLTAQELSAHKPYASYGPEPLGDELSVDYLLEKASRRPNITIKQFILEQSIIAGIGNIYADESLFESKIYPGSKLKDISKQQMASLLRSIQKVLVKGILYGGTSSEHYLQATGEKGSMQHHLQVYRRTGQPCPRCGAAIERMVIGGRGTHYCPQCQKKY